MGTLAPVPGIRGRAAEIAVLGDAVDRVVSGRPAVVLIEGEAGIGKTRLLAGVLEDARGRGMQVAAGRAEELERTRPFGLVAAAFGCVRSSPDPRRAAIAALLATRGGDRGPITVTSDPGLRFRAVDAFADLAEELALAGPLVIGVDDLQWADPSSLLTLAAVSRRLAYLPVALIGCLRPSPRIPELDRLAGLLLDAGGRILTVRGLTERAVTELVAEAVAAVPGPGLLAGISGAAGNPLFVTELLGALAQEGAIETAGGRAEVAEVTLPPTLRLTILRRLSFLPEDTLQALRAASILGSSFTVTELSVTMARPALELSVVLAEGIAGRVLEEYGAVIRFRHDLIRDAIYEDLPLSVRRGLHREAGQRLAQTGAPALQVAEQLARGAGQGDAEAIGWLTRAAREAAARSPDIAADLLERAAGLMAPADPGRDRLLAERASSLMISGRIADALAACRSLLDRDLDPQVDGPVRICLGRALLAQGQVRDALQELEQAGSSPALPGAERAAAQAWAGFARMSLGDLDGAAASAEQARSAAAAAGDHLTVSVAMTTLARVSESRGHLRDALQITDEAMHLADESPGRLGHRYPIRATRGHILIELGRPEEARSALGAGMRISEEIGVRWPLLIYHGGELGQALATMTGAWDTCARLGLALDYPAVGADLVRLALAAGDIGRARDASAAVTEVAARNEVPWMTGAALRCRGLIEDDAEILQAAAGACAGGSRPLGLALACEDAGAAFARQGRLDRARPLLDQALGIYERLGAARDLARAEATLREAGIRRGRRGTRGRPQIGWASLTPAEHAVAGLVAEGLSNPQIGERLYISRRTVQTHLAHMFAKLDIATRAQLAVDVTRHRGSEPADTADSAGG